MDIHYSRYGNDEESDHDESYQDWEEMTHLERDDDHHAGDGSVYRGKYEDINYNCEKLRKMSSYQEKYDGTYVRLLKKSEEENSVYRVCEGYWTGWNWNHIYDVPRYMQIQTKGKPYDRDVEYRQCKFNLDYHFIEFIKDKIVVDCWSMEEGIVQR